MIAHGVPEKKNQWLLVLKTNKAQACKGRRKVFKWILTDEKA